MTSPNYVDLQLRLSSAALAVRHGAITSELSTVARELQQFTSLDLPSRVLQQRLGLSDMAMRVVWSLTSMMLDGAFRARVSQELDSNRITADAIARIVYDGSLQLAFVELGPIAPLRQLNVIERCDGGPSDLHETQWAWTISRRIVAWLYGDTSIDPELTACKLAKPIASLDDLALASGVAVLAREAVRMTRSVVLATGARGLGRRSVLVAAAHERAMKLLEIDARKLSNDPRELACIVRECKLMGAFPLVLNVDVLDERAQQRLGDRLNAINGPIFATSVGRGTALRWNRPVVELRLAPPSSKARAKHWHRALGTGDGDAQYLAGQYPIAPALVERAAEAARARAAERDLEPRDIEAGVRSVLDDRLSGLAQRLDVKQSWDDLVIADDHVIALRELVARVRRRGTVYEDWGFADKVGKGLGVAALFSGPPGTGKTMLASLIARELNLEIYVADLSKLVSKYVGETEKQLSELFDAAEAAHAVLLFDEADSLFGKRTDVKSSNDRYANLETNYLLQRLESFTGICILTSNHESNIDPAFQRRLSLHLRLELPTPVERAALWKAMMPTNAPVEVIDFRNLAHRFEMSGGYIKNAALRAAFLAADEQTPITEALLHRSAMVEYEAMGKIV